MFTLTEIATAKENVTRHQKLGDSFIVIEREISPNEFVNAYNHFYSTPDDGGFKMQGINKDVYAMLTTEGGRDIIPLYKGSFYYVVTENGKTFKNLTFK